jgi:hypothetical protein
MSTKCKDKYIHNNGRMHLENGSECGVFNANFNNILLISWRSVLLVEEIGVPAVK